MSEFDPEVFAAANELNRADSGGIGTYEKASSDDPIQGHLYLGLHHPVRRHDAGHLDFGWSISSPIIGKTILLDLRSRRADRHLHRDPRLLLRHRFPPDNQ
jgi:hypothetical protein